MNRDRCVLCGCFDLDLSKENPSLCWTCDDTYRMKPNRYKVLRLPRHIRRVIGKADRRIEEQYGIV